MSAKDPRIVAEIARVIAKELGVGEGQVAAAIQLIEEGASVPFIARYRKERTGGLDDTQLRTLAERFEYLTILNDRREVVLRSIGEQGKLTPELEKQIRAATTKVELEDLYAPIVPSAAPRRRSPAKPGSSRWRSACSPTPRSIRWPKRSLISPLTRASRMQMPPSKARAIS